MLPEVQRGHGHGQVAGGHAGGGKGAQPLGGGPGPLQQRQQAGELLLLGGGLGWTREGGPGVREVWGEEGGWVGMGWGGGLR